MAIRLSTRTLYPLSTMKQREAQALADEYPIFHVIDSGNTIFKVACTKCYAKRRRVNDGVFGNRRSATRHILKCPARGGNESSGCPQESQINTVLHRDESGPCLPCESPDPQPPSPPRVPPLPQGEGSLALGSPEEDRRTNQVPCDDGSTGPQDDIHAAGGDAGSGEQSPSCNQVSTPDDDLQAIVGHPALCSDMESDEIGGTNQQAPAEVLEEISQMIRDAKRPRRGSGAALRDMRTQPLASGHTRSTLQAAYSLVEIKQAGASNAVLDMVAMNNHLLLSEFEDDHKLSDVHVPKSLHMAKHVLGTEDAAKYEFGWCPVCAWRYPPDPDRANKTKSELLTETCPNCGTAKYEVC